MGEHPELSRWVQNNHKGLHKRKAGQPEGGGEGNVMMEAESGAMQP